MSLTRKPAEPGGYSTFRRKKPKPSKRSAVPVTAETYALLVKRAHARCEAPVEIHRDGRCRGRLHAHHRIPVSWGGKSDVCNLLLLCEHAHSWAHGHPTAACVVGLIVPRNADPRQWPLRHGPEARRLTPFGEYEATT